MSLQQSEKCNLKIHLGHVPENEHISYTCKEVYFLQIWSYCELSLWTYGPDCMGR